MSKKVRFGIWAWTFVLLLLSLFVCVSCGKPKKDKPPKALPSSFYISYGDSYNAETQEIWHTADGKRQYVYDVYLEYDLVEELPLFVWTDGLYVGYRILLDEEFYQLNGEPLHHVEISKSQTLTQSYYINQYSEDGLLYHAYTLIFRFHITVNPPSSSSGKTDF